MPTPDALTQVTSLADTNLFMVWDGVDLKSVDFGDLKKNVAGKTAVQYKPDELYIPTTNPAGAPTNIELGANNRPLRYIEFSGAANQFVFGAFPYPLAWDQTALLLTYKAWWYSPGTTAAICQWTMDAGIVGDLENLDAALGTAVTLDDTADISATALQVTTESLDVTPAGSASQDAFLTFRFGRNGATDALADAARLLGLRINITLEDTNEN